MPDLRPSSWILALALCPILLTLLSACRSQPAEPSHSAAHSEVANVPGAQDSSVVPVRVMTYNIRYNNPSDTAWVDRRPRVASMIRFHRPDVVGTQEGQLHQLMDLEDRLPGYEWIGVGRKSGGDEFSALFYRTDRLELLEHDTFWLSTTPEEPGSTGWDAALPRIATWARFRNRETGTVFVVLNTHFDHKGETARVESARLIVQRIPDLAGSVPAVVTGDFNAEPTDEPIRVLTDPDAPLPLRDAKAVSETPHHGPLSTFNDFSPTVLPGRRIDYVFVSPGVQVRRHGHLSDRWGGGFPSDHLPVMVDLEF